MRASGIREILDLVYSSTADIDRLEIGEPGFAAPEHVSAAAARAAHGPVRYTQSAGTIELRSAIVESLGRRYDLDVDTTRVIVSQGAAQGIAAVFETVVMPGDQVLLPDPGWPNYEAMTLLRGAAPVRYPLRAANGFLPDAAELESLFTPATRVLVLNSPGNPTGAVLPVALVETLVRLAADRGVLVVSDEVYDELVFEGEPAGASRFAPDSVVAAFSFSKTYAMTGWRVGYLVLPEWLAGPVGHVQETLVSCVGAVAQVAALAALTGPQHEVATMRDAYRSRRDLAVGILAAGGVPVTPPAGAFYAMIPLAPGVDSRAAAIDLVDRGVAFAPGTAFGSEARGLLRMSLASPDAAIERGLGRLLDWYRDTEGGASLAEAAR